MYSSSFLLLVVILLIQKTDSRNQGCSMLVLVDDTVMSFVNNDQNLLRQKVDTYIRKLNQIYQNTILKDPPNNNLYFYVKHVTVLQNFITGCTNKQVSHVLRNIRHCTNILSCNVKIHVERVFY